MRSGLGGASVCGQIGIPFVVDRLRALGVPNVGALACGAVLVVDTYDPEERARQAQRGDARLRVLVDDLGGPVPPGYDVVWNPNAYADRALYPGFGGKVLAGRDAVPVREGLPAWTGGGDEVIAVLLGGGRPPSALVSCIVRFGERVGVGRLRAAGTWVPPEWGRMPAGDPWATIATARVLVTNSGSTLWEAAHVGVPVVPVCSADNQRLIWEWAVAQGAAGVDMLACGARAEAGAEALLGAVSRARPLPAIANGAPAVCRTVAKLAWEAGEA